MIERAKKSDEERFMTKYEKDPKTLCWNWKAGKHPYGYGFFYCTISEKRSTHQAHRYSYFLYKGKIPAGMYICHHCDNPGCVNPSHLFLGTPKDNMEDMMKKGRHCYGEERMMVFQEKFEGIK